MLYKWILPRVKNKEEEKSYFINCVHKIKLSMVCYVLDCCLSNKAVGGSGSEGTSNYVGGGGIKGKLRM